MEPGRYLVSFAGAILSRLNVYKQLVHGNLERSGQEPYFVVGYTSHSGLDFREGASTDIPFQQITTGHQLTLSEPLGLSELLDVGTNYIHIFAPETELDSGKKLCQNCSENGASRVLEASWPAPLRIVFEITLNYTSKCNGRGFSNGRDR